MIRFISPTTFYESFKDILAKVAMKLRWRPTSQEDLEQAETKVLSSLKTPYNGYYVNIGEGWGLDANNIWTIETNPPDKSASNHLPLVMVHGFGCGVGIWSLNFDLLSSHRKVYAMDLLGFGRSSRPNFTQSELAEYEFVESMERWRKAVGLNQKFILLGHSLGAFLSLAYALKYPSHISHIILADPWGIPVQQTAASSAATQITIPAWVRLVARIFIFGSLAPLAILRAAGPWGPSLIHKVRPDLKKKFQALTPDDPSDGPSAIIDYIYHCNAQYPPSGELAFKSLCKSTGWAKNPMIQRIGDLDSGIDLTFIYGQKSWIDRQPGIQVKHLLTDRVVQVHVIKGAGHHVYVDDLESFNSFVNTACDAVDEKFSKENADHPVGS